MYAKDETEERSREIEEERARLQMIFDHTEIAALALYDAASTKLLATSPHFLNLVAQTKQLDAQDLLGRKWHELTLIESPVVAMSRWDEVMTKHVQTHVSEIHLQLTPDGPETVIDYYLTPIMDHDNPDVVRFVLVSAFEVTEHTQAREEVEQLNRLKDEFFSLASHELRTPLTSIVGNAELLRRSFNRLSSAEATKADFERERNTIDRIIH